MESVLKEKKGSSKLSRIIKIAFIAFMAVYFAVVIYFGNTPWLDAVSYAVSQILFVFSMGFALALVIKPNVADRLEFVIVSCFLGVLANVVVYMIAYGLGLNDYLQIFMFAFCILSIFVIYKKKKHYYSLKTQEKGAAALCISIAVMLIIILFQTILSNFKPDFSNITTYYQDQLFNVGNVSALVHDFPADDIRNAGMGFSYHYLYNMFLAIYGNIFEITSFDLIFKLFPITQLMLFAGSSYLLFTRFIKNRMLCVLASFLILLADRYFFFHAMWAAFGTTFGFALAALSLYFFLGYIKRMDEAKIWDKDFILSMVFLAATSFAKAPYAFILLAGYGLMILWRLIKSKNKKALFIHGVIAIIAIAVSVVTLLMGVKGYNSLTIGFGTFMTALSPSYYVLAMQNLGGVLSPAMIKLMTYPVFLAINYTFAVMGFFSLLFVIIKYRKEKLMTEKLLFILIILGLIVGSVTQQPGSSNMFFMMAVVPYGLMGIILTFKRVFADENVKKKAAKTWLVIIIVLSAISLVNQINLIRIQSYQVVKPYPVLGYTEEPLLNHDSSVNCITAEEYEGMMYLRENTEKTDIIAGDRYFYSPDQSDYYARYFYYTAFSERQFYLEGYNYVNTKQEDFMDIINDKKDLLAKVYSGDTDAVKELKEQGVTYIVKSEFTSPAFFLDNELGEIVFGNNDIVIYKLK